MDLLANDLSIHGQFHDTGAFRGAIARMKSMRAAARRFDLEVHCNRMLLMAEPMPGVPMQQALQKLSVDQQRSVMRWLTSGGPFWDEDALRRHGADDYLEYQGEVVTDHALGEAAYRTLHDMECALVSFTPSDWDFSPVAVTWRRDGKGSDDPTVASGGCRSERRQGARMVEGLEVMGREAAVCRLGMTMRRGHPRRVLTALRSLWTRRRDRR